MDLTLAVALLVNGRTVLDGDKLDEEAIKTSGRVIRCS